MNAELAAYLARLAHPERRDFATRYANAILSGKQPPKPKYSKGLDKDTATKIMGKVARYAKSAKPADTPSACNISEGLEHLPEAIRAYAEEQGNADLLAIVEGFAPSSSFVAADEKLSDYYQPKQLEQIVETADVDCIDITDLEPSLARALALKLVRWNGRGKVYSHRNGRRYLHRDIKRIDLQDATVQMLPNYSDLVTTMQTRGIVAN